MKNRKRLFGDSDLWRKTMPLALPIGGQALLAVGMNMADTVMLGKLGDVAISAASMAGQYVTLFLACVMGVGMGVSVLTNRYWVAHGQKEMQQAVTLMLRWELLITVLFALPVMLVPEAIMGVFSDHGETIREGSAYLRWLLPAFVLIAPSQGCTMVLRSAGKLTVPLWGAGAALGTNVLLNWILIEGRMGLPSLEVEGAAVATSAGYLVQAVVVCGYFFFRETDIGYRPRDLITSCNGVRREYLRISLPVLISDGLLALGSSVISMVMGHMGPAFAAANSVTVVVLQVSTVLHHGLAGAAGVITGHTLGEGERERAQSQGYGFVAMGVWLGLAASVVIALLRRPILGYYHVSGDAAAMADQLLMVLPLFVTVQSVNGVLTKGVLRAGGDTRFLVAADNLFLWLVSIPLGLLSAFVWGWNAVLVYEVMKVDQLLKLVWCLVRLRSGKWRKNIKGNA